MVGIRGAFTFARVTFLGNQNGKQNRHHSHAFLSLSIEPKVILAFCYWLKMLRRLQDSNLFVI